MANTARVGMEARRQRRVPFWPAQRIERAQRRRLGCIVRHAYETVPFWRETMRERGLTPREFESVDDLKRLPLVDGATLHERPMDFSSMGFAGRDSLTLSTSASSRGIPKAVRWDAGSQLLKLAYAERDRVVLSRLAGKGWGQRQMWILPDVASAYAVREWWDERIVIPRGLVYRKRLSPEVPFENWVEELERYRPLVVYSYGSSSERFFRWLKNTSRSACLPRVWVYGGERMAPEWRACAEERGCRVLSTYQSVEAGRIGFECEQRSGFHLNIDLCAIRIVDPDGREVPPDSAGEVVVSNLINRATVLLNLRTGDRAALAPGPCPCGRNLPLLSGLEGRTWEMLRLGDGREIGSTDLFNALRRETAFALEFQLVHPAPGRIVWRIVVDPGADADAASRRLADRTREVLGSGAAVEVVRVSGIDPDPSGKWRLVVLGDG